VDSTPVKICKKMALSPLGRENLNFAEEAKTIFSFLEGMGLILINSSDTLVEYSNNSLSVVLYHGRQSYEIGCEIVNQGVVYYISEIITIYDVDLGSKYRDAVASTPEDVRRGLIRLRDIFIKYALNAVRGDHETFSNLANQRRIWAKDLELKTKISSIKPRADEAFRLRNYAEASELYNQIRDNLTPSESIKADLALERALRQSE
jgi:hypothetical protein